MAQHASEHLRWIPGFADPVSSTYHRIATAVFAWARVALLRSSRGHQTHEATPRGISKSMAATDVGAGHESILERTRRPSAAGEEFAVDTASLTHFESHQHR